MDFSDKEIREFYLDPSHPISFTSPGAAYDFFGGRVSLERLRRILSSLDPYTLHREYKKPKNYNLFYAYRRRTHFQADLIDISELHRANSFYRYLLVIIDVFTRKIWVLPLKKKTASNTEESFSAWLKMLDQDEQRDVSKSRKRYLYTDRGKEFTNARVDKLFKDNNFVLYFSQRGLNKAAIAERVNKTLQTRIYKYLTYTGRKRFIDVLPNIVNAYNNSKHRTLEKMTPNSADLPQMREKVQSIHNTRYNKVYFKMLARRKAKSFKKGDYVLIKVNGGKRIGKEARAYTPSFQTGLHVVTGVSSRMPVKLYTVFSMEKGTEVPGKFYANELTAVNKLKFKIERVLRQRRRGNITERFVKLEGLHQRFNSWVPTTAIDRFKRVSIAYLNIKPTLENFSIERDVHDGESS